jgi:hypothetical protein
MSLIFSKLNTFEKNSTERSMSKTVIPIDSTDFTSCADAPDVQRRSVIIMSEIRTLTLALSLEGRGEFLAMG